MMVFDKNMLANTDFALVQAEHGAIGKIPAILPENRLFGHWPILCDQYFSGCRDLLHIPRQ